MLSANYLLLSLIALFMKAEDPHQLTILREQTKLLFEHLPFVLYGVMASSAGLVAVLWHTGQGTALLLWLLAVYMLTGLRWWVRRYFNKLGAHFDPHHWIQVAIQFTAASGILWGFAGVVFFSTDPMVLGDALLQGQLADEFCILKAQANGLDHHILQVAPVVNIDQYIHKGHGTQHPEEGGVFPQTACNERQ